MEKMLREEIEVIKGKYAAEISASQETSERLRSQLDEVKGEKEAGKRVILSLKRGVNTYKTALRRLGEELRGAAAMGANQNTSVDGVDGSFDGSGYTTILEMSKDVLMESFAEDEANCSVVVGELMGSNGFDNGHDNDADSESIGTLVNYAMEESEKEAEAEGEGAADANVGPYREPERSAAGPTVAASESVSTQTEADEGVQANMAASQDLVRQQREQQQQFEAQCVKLKLLTGENSNLNCELASMKNRNGYLNSANQQLTVANQRVEAEWKSMNSERIEKDCLIRKLEATMEIMTKELKAVNGESLSRPRPSVGVGDNDDKIRLKALAEEMKERLEEKVRVNAVLQQELEMQKVSMEGFQEENFSLCGKVRDLEKRLSSSGPASCKEEGVQTDAFKEAPDESAREMKVELQAVVHAQEQAQEPPELKGTLHAPKGGIEDKIVTPEETETCEPNEEAMQVDEAEAEVVPEKRTAEFREAGVVQTGLPMFAEKEEARDKVEDNAIGNGGADETAALKAEIETLLKKDKDQQLQIQALKNEINNLQVMSAVAKVSEGTKMISSLEEEIRAKVDTITALQGKIKDLTKKLEEKNAPRMESEERNVQADVSSEATGDPRAAVQAMREELEGQKRVALETLECQMLDNERIAKIALEELKAKHQVQLEESRKESIDAVGAAVLKAATEKDEAVEAALIEATKEKDEAVQAAILKATKEKDEAIEAATVKATKEKDDAVEAAILKATKEKDEAVEAAVLEATKEKEEALEAAVLQATKDKEEAIESALLKATNEKDEAVERAELRAASEKEKAVQAAVLKAAREKEEAVELVTSNATREKDKNVVLSSTLEATKESNESLEAVILKATKERDEAVQAAILKATKEKDEAIEAATVKATKEKDDAVEAAILKATKEKDEAVEAAVLEATKEKEEALEAAVLQATKDKEEAIESALLKATNEKDEAVERAELRAASEKEKAVQAAVLKAAREKEEEVRAVILKVGKSNEEAVEAAILQATKEKEEATEAAILKATREKDEALKVAILKATREKEEAVKSAALKVKREKDFELRENLESSKRALANLANEKSMKLSAALSSQEKKFQRDLLEAKEAQEKLIDQIHKDHRGELNAVRSENSEKLQSASEKFKAKITRLRQDKEDEVKEVGSRMQEKIDNLLAVLTHDDNEGGKADGCVADVEGLKSIVRKLEEQIAESEETISKFRNENSQVRGLLEEATERSEAELSAVKEELERIKSDLMSSEKDKLELRAKLHDAEKGAIASLEEREREGKQVVESLRKQVQEAEETAAKIRKDLEAEKERVMEANEGIESLQEQVREAEERTVAIEARGQLKIESMKKQVLEAEERAKKERASEAFEKVELIDESSIEALKKKLREAEGRAARISEELQAERNTAAEISSADREACERTINGVRAEAAIEIKGLERRLALLCEETKALKSGDSCWDDSDGGFGGRSDASLENERSALIAAHESSLNETIVMLKNEKDSAIKAIKTRLNNEKEIFARALHAKLQSEHVRKVKAVQLKHGKEVQAVRKEMERRDVDAARAIESVRKEVETSFSEASTAGRQAWEAQKQKEIAEVKDRYRGKIRELKGRWHKEKADIMQVVKAECDIILRRTKRAQLAVGVAGRGSDSGVGKRSSNSSSSSRSRRRRNSSSSREIEDDDQEFETDGNRTMTLQETDAFLSNLMKDFN